MTLRRKFWGILLSGMLLAAAPVVPNFKKRLDKEKQIEHALSRLTFGATPSDLESVQKIGLKKWMDRQLNPQSIPENPALTAKLANFETLRLSTEELALKYPPPQVLLAVATGRMKMPDDPELKAMYQRLSERYKTRIEAKKGKLEEEVDENARKTAEDRLKKRAAAMTTEQRAELIRKFAPQQAVAMELTEAKIYRAVMSERQLAEVLTDFWFNHFNVFLEKGADKWLTTSYERDAIRPHVLGKFEDMVKATAQHPAMLFYLDNWQSVSNEFGARMNRRTKGKARVRGLNENYARELMELHTLGVDGGYSQKDVQEVARCFTGWTIDEPNRGGKFHFAPRVHDDGEKIVLGQRIPAGGGMNDGFAVIHLLAKHPSTAKFLSRKLAQRFVADEPPAALVERMAAAFLKTDGDLKAVMKSMLDSPEFFTEGAYRAKMKSPLEMVAGALRATGAEISSALEVSQGLAQMGQPLYKKQEPTGYSNNGEDWVNSAGLLARMNFAIALGDNKIRGVKIDRDQFAAVAKNTGAPEWQRR
jgi:uncharacterized protein (DUF1800 family)